MNAPRITSIEYETFFVLNGEMTGRDYYRIEPDGKVEHAHFTKSLLTGSGLKKERTTSKKVFKFSVNSLYKKVADCIEHTDGTLRYIDGRDATLTVHTEGGTSTYNRGVAVGETSVGLIMDRFLRRIGEAPRFPY